MNPATASLNEIRAWVGERFAGSPEPVVLHFVTCNHAAHEDTFAQGAFCASCIGAAAVAQGFDAECFDICDDDQQREWTAPRWCETCGVPLIGRLDDREVGDELDHWLDEDHHAPRLSEEWREFSLCLVEPPEPELPRIRAVIARALTAGVTS